MFPLIQLLAGSLFLIIVLLIGPIVIRWRWWVLSRWQHA